MNVKITSCWDRSKVFDLMKHIIEKYPLEEESKVVLNDDDSISVYLVVSDVKKDVEDEGFAPNISDEKIPF